MRILSAIFPTAIAVCACAILATPARAQLGWEWEPGEGYDREEWYDPSDWFDDDATLEYEYDYYDWGYYDPYHDPYGYGYDYFDYYHPYHDDFDYYDYFEEEDYYGAYGDDWFYLDADDWVWSSERNEWVKWAELQDESGADTSGKQDSYGDQGATGSQREGDQAQGSGDRQRQKLAMLRGTVDSFSTVKLQGESEEHTVLRIQLEDGSQRLVNLGPNPQLEQLRLRPGAAIRVEGRRGHISGKRVLIATRIRIAESMDAMNTMNADMVSIRGEVDDWRKMKLGNGDRRDHLLVRLKLENDRTAIVNFGPNASLGELGLEQGDHVMIRGTKRQVSGRKVVFVRNVRIEQEPIRLDWSPSGGQRGEAASPSR